MQLISIKMTGDEAWPEMIDQKVIELPTEEIKVAFLDNGTTGGQPVAVLRVDDGDTSYILQLTAASLRGLSGAFEGKYGDGR